MTGSVIGASGHHPQCYQPRNRGTIRPVIRQRNCGRSRKYPPRYRASNSGQLAANIRPVVSQRFSGLSAPLSDGQFGEPRRPLSAPATAVAKAPQCPQSVDAPLSPVNSGKPTGSIRPVTGVAGASLPHHQPQFRSRSGRLRSHQATLGSTVTPGLDGEHRGELHPRAGLHCVWEPGQRWHRSRGNYVRTGEV
jgi:hypothetical protein